MDLIPDIACAGILVADMFCGPMDHLPVPGELVRIDRFVHQSGGCAANVAIDLAKQGVLSRVVGRVGRDAPGQSIMDDLSNRGIDVSAVSTSDAVPTSQTVILVTKGEDRRFVHSFGANADLVAEDLAQALHTCPDILYLGGFLALPGLRPALLAETLDRARRSGCTTILDVVVPAHLRDFEPLWRVLPSVDVFLPNEDEARRCTGLDDPVEQTRALQNAGAATVVVTMGEKGAIIRAPDGTFRVGVMPVEYVDGSGGGDAFAAGLIKGLSNGWPLTKAAQLGAVLGASCVTAVGCHDGLQDKDTTMRALTENPPPLVRI